MSVHDPSGLGSCLAGNDAITLLESIHKSLSCEVMEDFIGLFPKIQELLSCDFVHAIVGYHDDTKGVVIVDGVNISFPDEWCIEYKSKNYVQSDPVVKENFTSFTLQNWSDTQKRIPYNATQKKIASLCRDFDMKEGYTFGLRSLSPGKNGSMFCYSGRSIKKDKRTAAILEYVTHHLHLALAHIYDKRRSDMNNVVVTNRETEVLNWLKQGKSSWDISVILGISESTTNYHIYNIMRKLDASNRPQAVAVAARLGLIDLG